MGELFRICHCERVVCGSPPKVCPLCLNTIIYEDIPPVVSLENIFTDGHSLRGALSVILKPTNGIWTTATQHEEDLHIGVSDSVGGVLNYFSSGLIIDICGWEQCIVVYEVAKFEARIWQALWTSLLRELSTDESWSIRHYRETTHNCFDFVIQFLLRFKNEVSMRCGELTELDFMTDSGDMENLKSIFVNNFVIGKMKAASNRIRVKHKVEQHGFALE